MMCVHCGQALQDGTEDGPEVCRFCVKQYGARRKGGLYAARCSACAEGRAEHNPDDLERCRLRLELTAS